MSEYSFQPCERCRRGFEEASRARRQLIDLVEELERRLRGASELASVAAAIERDRGVA